MQRVPGRIKPSRKTLRHIVIKPTKIKDRDKILNATRETQQITYKPSSYPLISQQKRYKQEGTGTIRLK